MKKSTSGKFNKVLTTHIAKKGRKSNVFAFGATASQEGTSPANKLLAHWF